jgi:hypothetical protein
MRLPISSQLAALIVTAGAAFFSTSLPATAGPLSASQGASSQESAVQLVHDGYWRRRHRDYYDDYYVDAPSRGSSGAVAEWRWMPHSHRSARDVTGPGFVLRSSTFMSRVD